MGRRRSLALPPFWGHFVKDFTKNCLINVHSPLLSFSVRPCKQKWVKEDQQELKKQKQFLGQICFLADIFLSRKVYFIWRRYECFCPESGATRAIFLAEKFLGRKKMLSLSVSLMTTKDIQIFK